MEIGIIMSFNILHNKLKGDSIMGVNRFKKAGVVVAVTVFVTVLGVSAVWAQGGKTVSGAYARYELPVGAVKVSVSGYGNITQKVLKETGNVSENTVKGRLAEVAVRDKTLVW
jgi:hypothetical protein